MAQRIEIYCSSDSKTKAQAVKNFPKEEKRFCQLSAGTTDNPLERCPKSMWFSRSRRRNKGGRERAHRKRKDTDL